MRKTVFIVVLAAGISCKSKQPPVPLPQGTPTPTTWWTSQMTDKTFYVADHFLASIEMQISGEPFAQLLGRNLAGYDRFNTHDRSLHRSRHGQRRSSIRSATRWPSSRTSTRSSR